MPDYALALDTTGPALGLGLSQLHGPNHYQTWDLEREISTHLHTYLTEFIQPLSWTDLAWISVAIGPGSYTGTRIGVVTARTLAQQLNLPLFGISTLAALARAASVQSQLQGLLAVELPAQPEQVYGAIYDSPTLSVQLPDQRFSLADWDQLLDSQASDCLRIKPHNAAEQAALICQGLLQESAEQWHRGDRPHWSAVNVVYL